MIYIDSDGIAADWVSYILNNYFNGITRAEMNSLPNLTERLKEVYKVEWHLFYNLEPIEGFVELLRVILATDDYRILTVGAYGLHESEVVVNDDKERWWRKHYNVPSDKVINVRCASDKSDYALSCSDILIDDTLSNVKAFVDAGGSGIYIPTSVKHSPERLEDFIKALHELRNLNPKINRYISLK